MTYVSLYRRWRPQTFPEVVGQEHVTRTLRNAISAGRVSHAYLFCGPRGTGKTSVAKLLAKALNCKNGPTPDPCGNCDSCARIKEGYSMDVVEIDAASNRGIDEIRELREKVKFAPVEARYKVYIIDEVHMLTQEAFNALLKTLEEPPSRVVFVLATTEPHKVLSTILSRCQRFDFRRLTTRELSSRIAEVAASEGIRISDDAVRLIAALAQGAARDALGLLEQCVAYTGGAVSYDEAVAALGVAGFGKVAGFCDAVIGRDLAAALTLVRNLADSGHDLAQFLKDVMEHFRNLLVLRTCNFRLDLVDASEATLKDLERQTRSLAPDEMLRAIDILSAAEADMRYSAVPLLTTEIAAIKLVSAKAPSIPGSPGVPGTPDVPGASGVGEVPGASGVASASGVAADTATDGATAATTAAATTTASGVGVTLGEIQGKWKDVLDLLTKKAPPAYTFFDGASPAGLTGSQLVVAFKNETQRIRASDARYRDSLRAVLKHVFGSELSVKCILAPQPHPQEPTAPESEVRAAEPEGEEVRKDLKRSKSASEAFPDVPWPDSEDVPPPEASDEVDGAALAGRDSARASNGSAPASDDSGRAAAIAARQGPARQEQAASTERQTAEKRALAKDAREDRVEPGVAASDGAANGNGGDPADEVDEQARELAEGLARARSAVMEHPAVKAALSVFGGRVFKIDI